MARKRNRTRQRRRDPQPAPVGATAEPAEPSRRARLLAYLLPIGTIGFSSLAAETAFYSVLTFSPVLLAGLLFSGSLKQADNVAFAYGANLLGAMLGGVAEYLALVTGYRLLLIAIALCYLVAIVLYPRASVSTATLER